jgi:hypothetical protein
MRYLRFRSRSVSSNSSHTGAHTGRSALCRRKLTRSHSSPILFRTVRIRRDKLLEIALDCLVYCLNCSFVRSEMHAVWCQPFTCQKKETVYYHCVDNVRIISWLSPTFHSSLYGKRTMVMYFFVWLWLTLVSWFYGKATIFLRNVLKSLVKKHLCKPSLNVLVYSAYCVFWTSRTSKCSVLFELFGCSELHMYVSCLVLLWCLYENNFLIRIPSFHRNIYRKKNYSIAFFM